MATSRRQAARRREKQKANRLARVNDALAAGDEQRHMWAAWGFAQGSLKKLPLDERATHQRNIAEFLVNYGLQQLDIDTRLKEVPA